MKQHEDYPMKMQQEQDKVINKMQIKRSLESQEIVKPGIHKLL